MAEKPSVRDIAEAIAAQLPGEPVEAAQVAIAVAAQRCVLAGVDHDTALVAMARALARNARETAN